MYECEFCNTVSYQKTDLINHLKSKKHLKHFNEEQKDLIISLLTYISSDIFLPLLINSAGGTGKTYTVSSVLCHYKNVIALGPTHQSVNVLKEEFKKSKTIHSFFGWEEDVDENGNDISKWNKPVIVENTIFVLDEISMMNDAMFSLYSHYIKGKYKVILMGDKAQLPPINKGIVKLPEEVKYIKSNNRFSSFFNEECLIKNLKINMRCKNKKNLSDFLTEIREDTLKDKEFDLDDNKILDETFLKKIRNTDYIVLCSLNPDVDYFNKKIKEVLFPDSYQEELVIGDKCIITKYYSRELHTGFRFEIGTFNKEQLLLNPIKCDLINTTKHIKSIKLNVFRIITKNNITFTKVCDDDYKKYKTFYSDNKKFISSLQKKDFIKNISETELIDKKKLLQKELKKMMSFHCYFKLNYATTVHKAQGKGYDNVIIYNKFHFKHNNNNKYTACSRSKKNLFISKNKIN